MSGCLILLDAHRVAHLPCFVSALSVPCPSFPADTDRPVLFCTLASATILNCGRPARHKGCCALADAALAHWRKDGLAVRRQKCLGRSGVSLKRRLQNGRCRPSRGLEWEGNASIALSSSVLALASQARCCRRSAARSCAPLLKAWRTRTSRPPGPDGFHEP